MGALETAEGGPTRDQRSRKEQRVWGCPFTHGRYSQLCPLCQVQPTTTSSGPSEKGGTAPGSVPLTQQDSSGPGHSFLHGRPQDSPTQRCSCPSAWAAPQPDSQPFTSPLEPSVHGALCQEARLGIETGDAAPPSQAHMKANAESDSRRENK